MSKTIAVQVNTQHEMDFTLYTERSFAAVNGLVNQIAQGAKSVSLWEGKDRSKLRIVPTAEITSLVIDIDAEEADKLAQEHNELLRKQQTAEKNKHQHPPLAIPNSAK